MSHRLEDLDLAILTSLIRRNSKDDTQMSMSNSYQRDNNGYGALASYASRGSTAASSSLATMVHHQRSSRSSLGGYEYLQHLLQPQPMLPVRNDLPLGGALQANVDRYAYGHARAGLTSRQKAELYQQLVGSYGVFDRTPTSGIGAPAYTTSRPGDFDYATHRFSYSGVPPPVQPSFGGHHAPSLREIVQSAAYEAAVDVRTAEELLRARLSAEARHQSRVQALAHGQSQGQRAQSSYQIQPENAADITGESNLSAEGSAAVRQYYEGKQAAPLGTDSAFGTSFLSAQNVVQHVSHDGTPTSLTLPADGNFLNDAHCFMRRECIEIFTSTEEHISSPGKGARPSKVGQVGLRCIHCKHLPRKQQPNQAICYPTKLGSIFESVRNFQRVHMEACTFIPENLKQIYQSAVDRSNMVKKSHKLVKAYYIRAALELGIKDSPHGMELKGEPYSWSEAAAKRLISDVMQAADGSQPNKRKDKSIEMGKFELVATPATKEVLLTARKQATSMVLCHDYPTVPDLTFLLFHQVQPCMPNPTIFARKGMRYDPNKKIPLLCCKYCRQTKDGDLNVKGMYFPTSVDALGDSSFSQTLNNHLMGCPDVPDNIKEALEELRSLGKEYGITAKRGAKRKFVEKIWERMHTYYQKTSALLENGRK